MKLEIQDAINWIEGKLQDQITLQKISDYIGYSSFHTSRKFKQYTGSTLKRYIMLRRLSNAAKELRDTDKRVIDIAFDYHYESQESFSKAFYDAFGVNPGKYRKTKQPIPLVFKKDVLFPDNLKKEGDIIMVANKEIKVKLVEVPAHKLFYIKRSGVTNYIDFWNVVDAEEGMDCDYLHGVLASIPGTFSEGFGAFTEDGYLFGKDAAPEYELEKDFPFEEKLIPAQKYLQFEHPGFTESEFEQALRQVRHLALEEFDYTLEGYEIDTSFVKAYEHSGMELCFYFIRIPIKSTQ